MDLLRFRSDVGLDTFETAAAAAALTLRPSWSKSYAHTEGIEVADTNTQLELRCFRKEFFPLSENEWLLDRS